MRIKEQCTISYDEQRQCFRVNVGHTIVHFGTLFSCEEWARQNSVPVRNQEELNRIKYSNMPVHEQFCGDHFSVNAVPFHGTDEAGNASKGG